MITYRKVYEMTFVKLKSNISKLKPNNYTNKNYECPFCNRETLRLEGRMIKETSDFLIVKNKYPTLEDTYSSILIEHRSCKQHMGSYTKKYLTDFLVFSLQHYEELMNSSNYTFLILFKNSGLFACGSIDHPHCQIIGFKNKVYQENIKDSDFQGIEIISDNDIEWNISTNPKSEFYEINILLFNKGKLDLLAEYLKKSINFILEVMNPKYQSYNLAFYIEKEHLKLKIIPRGPTSVLLLGYGIHQTPDNLEEVAKLLGCY